MSPPFEPRDFIPVAERLANHPSGEAELRTAIGRAYYAVFLVARDKFGISARNKQVHRDTQIALKKKNFAAGDMLGKLHRLRKVSDYELIPSNLAHHDWQKNWIDAKSMLDQLLRICAVKVTTNGSGLYNGEEGKG
jgi:hypothetical protein